jgi:hypothetical protein
MIRMSLSTCVLIWVACGLALYFAGVKLALWIFG